MLWCTTCVCAVCVYVLRHESDVIIVRPSCVIVGGRLQKRQKIFFRNKLVTTQRVCTFSQRESHQSGVSNTSKMGLSRIRGSRCALMVLAGLGFGPSDNNSVLFSHAHALSTGNHHHLGRRQHRGNLGSMSRISTPITEDGVSSQRFSSAPTRLQIKKSSVATTPREDTDLEDEVRIFGIPKESVGNPLVLLMISQFLLFIGVGAVIPSIPLVSQRIDGRDHACMVHGTCHSNLRRKTE